MRSCTDLGPRREQHLSGTRRLPKQTAEMAAFRRTRLKHGADEYLEPPRAPGCCPVPYASMGSAIKTGRSRRGISKVMIFLHHSGASEESLGRMKSDFFA